MKNFAEAVRELLGMARGQIPSKPVSYRATEAKADFMDGLPPELRALAIREAEKVIDLCESPIEQVALYQIAGHNFGNEEHPARCRILRKRGEIEYYPDRIHLTPQVSFGSYRVDFLLDFGGTFLLAIECDGEEFHTDKEKDRKRDQHLREEFKVRVARVSGKSIWRDNLAIASIATAAKLAARS